MKALNPHEFRLAGLVLLAAIAIAATPRVTAAQASAGAAPTQVTFTKNVAPIMQRSCQSCHRPGSIGPMSLLTYEDARPWAKSIKQKVSMRMMPPWHIDKTVGIQKFKEDISLTDEEIATLVAWVDGGAIRGNPADMPPPKQFESPDAWTMGGLPDLIVQIPSTYVIPAEGGDQWVEFHSPTGLTETRYVKALQGMPGPGASRNVHHLTTTVTQDVDESDKLAGDDSPEGDTQFLNEYAMGKNGDIMPEGTGKLLKVGSIINFQAHYHSIGEEIRDRSRIGFRFYPKGVVPKYYQISRHVGDFNGMDIPAGADNVRFDGYTRFNQPVQVTAVQAHMHNRGKRMCIEAILPTGQVDMLSCFNFDFRWHKVYNYAEDVTPLLPAGTVVHVIGWHDNSNQNRNNPDPRNWVGSGSRTSDEMNFAWMTWTFLTETDYKQKVAERKAKASSN